MPTLFPFCETALNYIHLLSSQHSISVLNVKKLYVANKRVFSIIYYKILYWLLGDII